MNTAYELMERLHAEGAARYGDTALAHDHTGLARRVRRQRATRTAGVSVASVAAASGVIFAAVQLAGDNHNFSPANPSPSSTGLPTPTPTWTDPGDVEELGMVAVPGGERIEYVAAGLAAVYGVTQDEALAAIVAALPAEAGGEPEGWVVAGEYRFDGSTPTLEDAAQFMVSMTTNALDGVPREQWLDTLILASILDKEAPVLTDKGSVARVIHNRLDQGMPLQLESPLAYYLRADEQLVADDGWAVDTPFNTYLHEGLPPTPIGSPSHEAIAAATNPATGDWLYFLRKPDGNVLLFSTYEDFAVAVDEYFPGTGTSD